MTAWRPALAWAAVALVAAVLRLTGLADRPMHADEAVLADKLGTLLEGRGYNYEATDYHGPALLIASIPPARAAGIRTYAGLTETVLRVTPAIAGLALVLLPLALARGLPRGGTWLAAAFTALSPAMAYWSRYYIPEMLLAAAVAGLIACGYAYGRKPRPLAAAAAGACAGIAWATKETAVIAVACLIASLLITRRAFRPLTLHHALLGLAAAVLVALLLFSPHGFVRSVESLPGYAQRAAAYPLHRHAPGYYLGLLFGWPGEAVLLALAMAGAVLVRAPLVRFLSVYGGLMLAVYSALPYKTPWCLIEFWQPLLVVAGAGATALFGLIRFRFAPAAAIGALCALLGWQATEATQAYASDPRNPYVYAHTARDVFGIRNRVLAAAAAHGPGFRVQVFSKENLWPLPWYLRSVTQEWSRGVPQSGSAAPVILASPEMEPAVVRKLYEMPQPGERELYVNLCDRYTELRPGVEVRGYVAKTLADKLR